jgi:hypothetical protein
MADAQTAEVQKGTFAVKVSPQMRRHSPSVARYFRP